MGGIRKIDFHRVHVPARNDVRNHAMRGIDAAIGQDQLDGFVVGSERRGIPVGFEPPRQCRGNRHLGDDVIDLSNDDKVLARLDMIPGPVQGVAGNASPGRDDFHQERIIGLSRRRIRMRDAGIEEEQRVAGGKTLFSLSPFLFLFLFLFFLFPLPKKYPSNPGLSLFCFAFLYVFTFFFF